MKRKPYHPNPDCGEKNNHHIFCVARYKKLKNNPNNKVVVDKKQHENFHKIFTDRNPVEIIDYLVNTFWGGNYHLVEEYLNLKKKGVKNDLL